MQKQQGMALIEVLVTMMLCVFILLSLIQLQIRALKSVNESHVSFTLLSRTSSLIRLIQKNPREAKSYWGVHQSPVSFNRCQWQCSASRAATDNIHWFLHGLQKPLQQLTLSIQPQSAHRFELIVSWQDADGEYEEYREQATL